MRQRRLLYDKSDFPRKILTIEKKGKEMKIYTEIPGELIYLLDSIAALDGHNNRSAVIRKAVQSFFNHGDTTDQTDQKVLLQNNNKVNHKNTLIAVELDSSTIAQIDKQAEQDGHTSRSAVVRKAVYYFFAQKVAFVANKGKVE